MLPSIRPLDDLQVRHSTLHEGDRVLVKNVGLRGKRKLADRWERTPYIVKSHPNPDNPVYEAQSENTRARKTRTLHRNILLPFSSVGLPCGRVAPRNAQDASDLVSPEDQIRPMQDDSMVRKPDSSTEESDTEDRASESHTYNNSDTPVPRYRIPMRRRSGELGVYPRSTSPSSMDSFNTEPQRPERPKRTHQPPAWMRSPDWAASQVPVYEFWVDLKMWSNRRTGLVEPWESNMSVIMSIILPSLTI